MKKVVLFISLLCFSFALFAQSDISGFVPLKYGDKKLETVDLVEMQGSSAKVLTSTAINDKGYFRFDCKLKTQPKFYYLSIDEHIIRSKQFFVQNKDSIFFKKSAPPLSKYESNSLSDLELRKLMNFENRIAGKKKYLDEIRNYSKDSLQILAVKLVSIKELEKKKLLDKDIALNKAYYSALLIELKESEINPQEYVFLELKLTQLHVLETEESYAMSQILNILLAILIVGLLFYFTQYRHRKSAHSVLSKQEQAIKNLILESKSNKEIASELFISVSTVKTHITSIYQKLQVSNRGDLILKFKK